MDLFKLAVENDLSTLQQHIEFTGVKDHKGKTLLHYAVLGSAHDVIDYLLSQEMNINHQDQSGETALFDCARKAKIVIAKKLLSKYAKVDITNTKGETVLHLACHKGDLDTVRLFIEKGANLKALTQDSLLPIHYAILAGHIHLIEYLMEVSKMSWFHLDDNKNSFLHFAAKTTNESLIKMFLAHELDPNQLNTHFETPLFNAVKFGTKNTVMLLLQHDAYLNVKNRRFETPLMLAKINHDPIMIDVLTSFEETPQYQRLIEEQALTVAVLNRDNELLKDLLNRNYKLKKDRLKQTAYDYATKYKLSVCIQLLRPF